MNHMQDKNELLKEINAFAIIKAEEIQKRQIIEREEKRKSLKISKTQEFTDSRGR